MKYLLYFLFSLLLISGFLFVQNFNSLKDTTNSQEAEYFRTFPSERNTSNMIPKPVKKYKVYTDSTIEERWKEAYEDFRGILFNYTKKLRNYLANEYITKDYYKLVAEQSKKYAIVDPEFYEEMEFISELTNISLEDLFIYNLQYDIVAFQKKKNQPEFCTSILVKKENEIIHAKNLDFIFPQYKGKLLFQMDYYDRITEKLIYSTSNIAGMIWANTFIRYDGYTATVNQRNKGQKEYNLHQLLQGSYISHQAVMKALHETSDFKEFVEKVAFTDTISPFYLNVASANIKQGGLVLQKSRNSQENKIKYLNDENWFIVQTNHDFDEKDPDGRSTQPSKMIQEIGQESITKEQIFDILQLFPSFNHHTIQTTMMNPQKGEFQTTNWWG